VDCTAPAVRDWEGRQDLGGCGGCGARDERGARQPSAAGMTLTPQPPHRCFLLADGFKMAAVRLLRLRVATVGGRAIVASR
jgi:hypothetical protein